MMHLIQETQPKIQDAKRKAVRFDAEQPSFLSADVLKKAVDDGNQMIAARVRKQRGE